MRNKNSYLYNCTASVMASWRLNGSLKDVSLPLSKRVKSCFVVTTWVSVSKVRRKNASLTSKSLIVNNKLCMNKRQNQRIGKWQKSTYLWSRMWTTEVLPRFNIEWTIEGHLEVADAVSSQRGKWNEEVTHLMMWFNGVRTRCWS